MSVDRDGSYLAGVSMSSGGTPVGQTVSEAVQPYSPEYRTPATGSSLLPELARLGNGTVIADPAEVFRRPDVARRVPQALWPPLLLAALLLLLLDVALRRIDLSAFGRPSMVTTIQKVTAAAAPPPPRKVPDAVARASAAAAKPTPAEQATEGTSEAEEPARVAVTPIGDSVEPEKPKAGDGTYMGGLLAARRRAKDRMEED